MSKFNDILKRIGYNNTNDVKNDIWAVKHGVDGKSQPTKLRPKSKIRAKHIPYSYSSLGHSGVVVDILDVDSNEYMQSMIEKHESELFDDNSN